LIAFDASILLVEIKLLNMEERNSQMILMHQPGTKEMSGLRENSDK
jgi:hypothetical protein